MISSSLCSENQVNYDEDEGGDGSYNHYNYRQGGAPSNPQQNSGVSGLHNPQTSGVSGKANRIGAYRKSNTFEVPLDGERSTERRRRTHAGGKSINKSPLADQENDVDESFNSPGGGGPDVKMAIQNLQETM